MPSGLRAGHHTYWTQRGAGPRVVLSHCALAHAGAWAGVIAGLKDAADCIAVDLPDHGQTAPCPVDKDPQRLAADALVSFMDGPTHLVGHSFGGTVALLAAVLAPGRVASLTLIEPVLFAAAKGTSEYDALQRDFAPFVTAWEKQDRLKATEVFLNLWGDSRGFAALPKQQQSYAADRIHVIPAQGPGLHEDVNGILPAVRNAPLTCPIQFIQGEDSPPIVEAIFQSLQSRLPQTRQHILPGAGHMAPLTHPREVAARIKAQL